ncbi:CRISPR-associated protein Cas5 [uncultured Clostridium sp.]|uniref:CRISPR-associated protein Cas5 n=1 Tax=uncultured Clostridium sp. TaxID=59620 RepID=UPI00261EFF87|nr:CRISPR-associated protein Cas5 [uncultured Clostridium sp.]
MKLKKIKIIAPLAHFKVPLQGKLQKTYNKPPISSVVGILQNIFDEKIDDFILGFTFNYKNISTEFNKIYKEVDGRENTYTNSRRFKGDNFITEHLVDTELIIYTDIDKEINLSETLVMGKTNYLATITNYEAGEFEEVYLIDKKGYGYNQWTDMNIKSGMPIRINTLTKFNSSKCAYDYKMALVKNNKEFEYDKFYDENEEQNIFLWHWKEGEINAVR